MRVRALAALGAIAVLSGCVTALESGPDVADPAPSEGTFDEAPTDGQPLLAIEREFIETRYGVDVRCHMVATLAPEIASTAGAQGFGFPPDTAAEVAAYVDPRRAAYVDVAATSRDAALRRGALLGVDADAVAAQIAEQDRVYRGALGAIAVADPAVGWQTLREFLDNCEGRYQPGGEGVLDPSEAR